MRTPTPVIAAFLLTLALVPSEAQQPAPDSIQKLLDEKKVTVDFVETHLVRVMEEFGRQTGIRWLIDSKAIPTPRDLIFMMKLHDLPARRFLEVVCRDHRLGTRVAEGDVLVVTTAETLSRRTELRMFDVRADSDVGSWYDADLGFRRSSASGFTNPFDLSEADWGTAGVTSEELQNMIKDNIAKGTWDSEGRSLVYYDGVLIVRHQPEVVAEIGRVLRTMHERRPRPMMLEWGIVDLAASAVPHAAARSALAPRIVGPGAERQAWEAVLDGPSAAWTVRRRFPLHSTHAPEQGSSIRLDRTRGAGDGGWSFLTPEAIPYRRGPQDRVVIKFTLDHSDPPEGGERRETHRVACALDLADGDLAYLPIAESQGIRALVLRVSMVAPAGWAEEREQPPAEDPSLAGLRARLGERVSLDLPAATLDRHLDVLRQKTGCNFHLAGNARSSGTTENRIEMAFQDVSLQAAFSLIAEQYGLGWKLTPGLILFDVPEGLDPVAPVTLIDVRDLLQASPTARPPSLAKSPLDSPLAAAGTHLLLDDLRRRERSIWAEDEQAMIMMESLQDLIKQNVAPMSWEERQEETAVALDATGGLWVVHTPPVIREIREFLDRLRALVPQEIALEYRLVAVSQGEAPASALPDDQASQWWSAAPGREALEGGGLITRAGGGAFAASVVRSGPAQPQRGHVLGVSLGTPSAEGVLSAWLRIDWADARLCSSTLGPAGGVKYQMAGYDGVIELQQGKTHLLVLGELEGGRSLVAVLRWMPSR